MSALRSVVSSSASYNSPTLTPMMQLFTMRNRQTEIYPTKSVLPSKIKTVTFPYSNDILCRIEYSDATLLPEGTSPLLAVYNITGETTITGRLRGGSVQTYCMCKLASLRTFDVSRLCTFLSMYFSRWPLYIYLRYQFLKHF